MWDDRYRTDEYVYGTHPNDFVVQTAGLLPKGRLLSLGEGEGRNAVFLAGLGHEVVAVDSSAVGLEKVRRLADRHGVEVRTVHAGLSDFEIEPGAWDVVISIFCHVPSSLRKDLHGRVARGLRPGGKFLIEAYTPAQLVFATGGPATADPLVTLESLEDELQGLSFEIGRELVRNISEGIYHNGRSAVVQALAVRPG